MMDWKFFAKVPWKTPRAWIVSVKHTSWHAVTAIRELLDGSPGRDQGILRLRVLEPARELVVDKVGDKVGD